MGHRIELARVGRHRKEGTLLRQDLRTGGSDVGGGRVGIRAFGDAHPIELRAVTLDIGAELVSRVEITDEDDVRELVDGARLGRRHAHLEGELGQVAEHLCAPAASSAWRHCGSTGPSNWTM